MLWSSWEIAPIKRAVAAADAAAGLGSPKRLATSRRALVFILVALSLLAIVSAVSLQAPDLLGRKKVLTDFDAFYVAGTMARHGQAAEAFQATKMRAAQQEIDGNKGFMPWTYPPPYMIIVEGLARMPIGAAYLLFISVSFLFYLWVLWRIAGDHLPGVLIAILPAVVLTVRCGQNAFLTGGLVGAFLLAFSQKRAVAGIPLGLMVIKPHIAAGIALLALLGKRWTTMAMAAAIVVVAVVGSIAAFGLGIWPAFFGAVHEAGQFLSKGYYLLFRMSSVYASIKTLGGPTDIAFILQGVSALAGIGLVLHVWRCGYDRRIIAAAACAASLLVSPYNYDYDLTLLGVAAAFVLRDIIKLAGPSELTALLFLSWTATGYGIGLSTVLERTESAATELKPATEWSLIAPALLLLLTIAFAILRRARASSCQ